MKQLSDYILESANFLVKKHITKTNKKAIPFIHPKEDGNSLWDTDVNDLIVNNIDIKTLKPFVIYYDKYHDKKHIASISDMIATVGSAFSVDDFEDFGPDDIIEWFDTLEDAVKYAIKDSGPKIKDYYDNAEWAGKVLDGEETTNEDFTIDDLNNGNISSIDLYKLIVN